MKITKKEILFTIIVATCATLLLMYIILPKIKLASIANQIEHIQSMPGFAGSTVAVDARYEGSKESIISIQSDILVHPGSNYKLLTAAASLHYLTPDFTFKTNFSTFEHNGKKHLLIEGSGDPTFHREDIQAIAQTLREKNILITGNLYYDDSYFQGEKYGPDWKAEWKDIHFGVPISALQIDDNILYIKGKGSAAKKNLTTSTASLENYPAIIDKRVVVTTPAPHKVTTKMDVTGTVILEGETSGDEEFSTTTNLQNPSQITAEVFRQELSQNGVISAKSQVIALENLTPEKTLIYQQVSAPLSEIVRRMLTFSKNNYGETLIRTLGEEVNKSSKNPNSQAKGVELLRKFLQTEVNIQEGDFTGLDGSGMSPSSRITGRGIMQLFEYVNKQPWKDIYWNALPTSSNEGTLHYRFMGAELQHQVIAKTGTHDFASSLSGKIPREHDTILFSIHIFNHHVASEFIGSDVQPIIDMIVKMLDERL